jgi:hypothetical protein
VLDVLSVTSSPTFRKGLPASTTELARAVTPLCRGSISTGIFYEFHTVRVYSQIYYRGNIIYTFLGDARIYYEGTLSILSCIPMVAVCISTLADGVIDCKDDKKEK